MKKYFDKRLMGVFLMIFVFLLRPAKLKRLKACDRKAACFWCLTISPEHVMMKSLPK